MPEALKDAWPCWRLWAERRASVTELETSLSIDDVVLMCAASDYWIEVGMGDAK